MIRDLKTVLSLLSGFSLRWMPLTVVGSLFLAALDMAGVIALLPLMQILTGAAPNGFLIGWISSLIQSTATDRLVLAISVFVGVVFVAKSLVSVAYRWWLLGKTRKMEVTATTELLRRYVSSSYQSHRAREIAVIHRNLGHSSSQAFGSVIMGILSNLADGLALVAMGAILLWVSPVGAAVALVFFGLLGWFVQSVLRKPHHRVAVKLADSDLSSWNAIMPSINGFRESRLMGKSHIFVERYRKAKMIAANASRQFSIMTEAPKYVMEVGMIVGIGVLASLLFATMQVPEALSILGLFAGAAARMLPTLNRFLATAGGIKSGQYGLHLLAEEIRELDTETKSKYELTMREKLTGDVVLKNVSFHFPDSDEYVLKGITCTFEYGKSTAIVGTSGAGKSTLLDIVLGLQNPTRGEIACGNIPLDQDLSNWYANLGVVPQDVFLLDDSLRANIAFGEEEHEVDQDRLRESIALAQLDEVIHELPDGLETRLGERGVRLSGGQRQRVGIARALYRDPSYLVLDEATSALDNETERKITETINRLSGTRTIIIVAHRLSTVRQADNLIFLEKGSITAQGTFDEVRAQSRTFDYLVSLGRVE